ncbi:MAG: glycosyl transferase [Bacteroidota bacterium]
MAVVVVGWALNAFGTPVLGLALPAIGIAVISAIDDIRSLSARIRFGVHLGAAVALVVVFGGWGRIEVPLLGTIDLGLAGALLGVFWLVGLTNAYNFMDGIDGIAATQGVVAGLGWMLVGSVLGEPITAMTGALVAGATAGFAVHNWPPAKIFMGDVGSAFLGFVFAALALVAGDGRIPIAALLFVWPFVFDSGVTFCRRLLKRENVFAAHRSHLYQRAVIAGVSHATVTTLYGGLALVSTVAGVVWASGGASWTAWAGLVFPPVTAVVFVLRAERKHEKQKLAGSAKRL